MKRLNFFFVVIIIILISTQLLLYCGSETGQSNPEPTKQLNTKKIVDNLVKNFTNPKTKVAENSLLKLKGLMQDKSIRVLAVKALVHNLNHENPKMRMRCAEALGREKLPPKVKEELEKQLSNETNQSVLIALVDALSVTGDESTIEKLRESAKSTNDDILKEYISRKIGELTKEVKSIKVEEVD